VPESGTARRVRPATCLLVLALAALALFAGHARLLTVPFYWDEVGQFIPAALDIARDGAWVPRSAVPNAHPPTVMAWLALVWGLFGYSVAATRAAMLAVAALAVVAAYLLAVRLGRRVPGNPALPATFFLCASPLFFAQSEMAQLDMPAMLWATVALLCFLEERMGAAALASTALVMTKETGLIVPAVLAAWLVKEKRYRTAALFLVPVVPLAAWFAVLRSSTGHLFGDPGFTHYNLLYPLHPVRLSVAVLRRLYYLFFAEFHWIGTAALLYAWWRTPLFDSRAWKVACLIVAAHVAAFSVAGGAALERYLLPVLPVLYAGMAAAMMFWPGWLRLAGPAALTLGLAAANFWNPPYPFPPESNLAWTDVAGVQKEAAAYLEARYPDTPIATAWPLAPALADPRLGYVRKPLRVRTLPDFYPGTVRALDAAGTPVFALFSHMWDPEWNWFRLPLVQRMWARYWNYRPDVAPREVGAHLPVRLVTRWSRRGWWVEVYEYEDRGPARGPAPR